MERGPRERRRVRITAQAPLGDRLRTAVLRVDEQRRPRVAEVNADLVGAPGERAGLDQRHVAEGLDRYELGHRRLALLVGPRHPHPGAAGGHQRRVDPDGSPQRRGDQRQVALLGCAVLEGQARRSVRGGVEREEQNAGGVPVQPVHHPHPPAQLGLDALPERRPTLLAPPGDDRHARGLVHRHQAGPGPEDGDHSTSSAERTSTGPNRSSCGRSRSAGPTTTVNGGSGKQ